MNTCASLGQVRPAMQGGDLVRRRAILAGVVAAPWFRVAHGLVAHRISPVYFNGFHSRYGAVDSKQLTCATDDACHGGSARLGRRSGVPASRRRRSVGRVAVGRLMSGATCRGCSASSPVRCSTRRAAGGFRKHGEWRRARRKGRYAACKAGQSAGPGNRNCERGRNAHEPACRGHHARPGAGYTIVRDCSVSAEADRRRPAQAILRRTGQRGRGGCLQLLRNWGDGYAVLRERAIAGGGVRTMASWRVHGQVSRIAQTPKRPSRVRPSSALQAGARLPCRTYPALPGAPVRLLPAWPNGL